MSPVVRGARCACQNSRRIAPRRGCGAGSVRCFTVVFSEIRLVGLHKNCSPTGSSKCPRKCGVHVRPWVFPRTPSLSLSGCWLCNKRAAAVRVASGVHDIVCFSVLPNARSECCLGVTIESQVLGSKSVQRVCGSLSVLVIDRRSHRHYTQIANQV